MLNQNLNKILLIPIRMAIIKNTDINECWQGVEKLEFSHVAGGNVKWKWENSLAVPQKC